MKRFFLFVLVILLGAGGFFWYRGDIPRWVEGVRNTLSRDKQEKTAVVPGTARLDETSLKPTSFSYGAVIERLGAPSPADRVAAWTELTQAYLEGDREAVLPALKEFVGKYVLSNRFPDDRRIAARVNVREGDSLSQLAKKYGTTVEAIKRLNGLTSNVIRPGLTLKILNQPMAVYVDKSDFRLWVLYGGRFLLEAPCGIGKDNRTPTGKFTIGERIVDPDWYRPDGTVLPADDPRNELGCRWLGFKDTALYTGLGIHEARNPDDVGKPSSNGCLRLLKNDVELLYDLLPLGTTVTIRD